jgi:hypothetical protein
MPSILKIGYQAFVVRRASDAAAVVRALADAVPVQEGWHDNRTIYYPDRGCSRHAEVSLRTVLPEQLRSAKPGEDIEAEGEPIVTPAPRKLRLLTGGGR